jgi:hypothetical protein
MRVDFADLDFSWTEVWARAKADHAKHPATIISDNADTARNQRRRHCEGDGIGNLLMQQI